MYKMSKERKCTKCLKKENVWISTKKRKKIYKCLKKKINGCLRKERKL